MGSRRTSRAVPNRESGCNGATSTAFERASRFGAALSTVRGARRSTAATGFVLFTLLALLPAGAQSQDSTESTTGPTRYFEYIYAEPNSGAASGGHVAIRFGEKVFHFQQVEGGILRMFRVDAGRFDHSYRALGNRSLRVVRVPVSDSTFELLQWDFDRYRIRQDAEFDALASLRDDRRLLEGWTAQIDGTHAALSSPPIAAAGYFATSALPEPRPERTEPGTTTLEALAKRVESELGAAFLKDRADSLRATIEGFDAADLARPPISLDDALTGTAEAGPARRFTNLVSEWLATRVLLEARPLATGAWVEMEAPEWRIEPAERERLGEIEHQLERSVSSLLGSRRPDRGFALLVALARIEALERSRSSGRWVLLDPGAGGEPEVPPAQIAENAGPLRAILEERKADFVAARSALLCPDSWDESRLSLLELAGAAWAELAAALDEGHALRAPPDTRVPVRAASPGTGFGPTLPFDVLRAARDEAARREVVYLAELTARYPYDLFQRNCVTEIFQVLERESLGGYVDPRAALTFVPAASSHAVEIAYPGATVSERASYRAAALARSARCDGALPAFLIESNTISSRWYSPHGADPLFLFFTDQSWVARPLLGVANLVVGAGGAMAGAFTAPWDGGQLVRRGWEGVLFSLPELAFVSLRRGTIPFTPWAWEEFLESRCRQTASLGAG